MPTPITKKGYEALKAEQERLRKERPKIIEAIAEARGVSLEEISEATTETSEQFFRFNRA